MSQLSIILNVYIWLAVCILLFFLFAIGRFYERKSGQRAFYLAFPVAIVIFAFATIRYIFFAPVIVGDLWGDILRFVGGLIAGGFGFFLLRLMTGRHS